MDLQDFEGQAMYFDTEMPVRVGELLRQAGELYGQTAAESKLIKAFSLAPKNLTVLVAMYRFYYYQHRWRDALAIADLAIQAAGEQLNMCRPWYELTKSDLGPAVLQSMGLVRFYFLALKGAGYLLLRMGDSEGAIHRLQKVVEMDPFDRLGANILLHWAKYGGSDGKSRLRLAYVNQSRLAS